MLQATACHRARVWDDPREAELESCQEARSQASCTPLAALLGWPLSFLAHACRPHLNTIQTLGTQGPGTAHRERRRLCAGEPERERAGEPDVARGLYRPGL